LIGFYNNFQPHLTRSLNKSAFIIFGKGAGP
jgi:hypothetical protein